MHVWEIAVVLDREGVEGLMPDCHGEELCAAVERYCQVYADQIKTAHPYVWVVVDAQENRTHSYVEINRYQFRFPVADHDIEPGEEGLTKVAMEIEDIGTKMLDLADKWT